ncbi:MAG: hypothetical protein ACMUJM_19975 [bacterium]
MKYTIEIPQSTVIHAFENALSCDSEDRLNFFSDLRRCLKKEIITLLAETGISPVPDEDVRSYNQLKNAKVVECEKMLHKGIVLDNSFCAGYGHDDYSLYAINYLYREYCQIPSLASFLDVNDFSIGNILIVVKRGDYEIEIKASEDLKFVGYCYAISSRKLKPYVCLFGIRFSQKVIKYIIEKHYHTCQCSPDDLDEVKVLNRNYPVLFCCRKCSKLFICKCFEGYFNIQEDIIRSDRYFANNEKKIIIKKIDSLQIREGICHLCTKKVPKLLYSNIYSPEFVQIYRAYIRLFARKYNVQAYQEGIRWEEPENLLRQYLGFPQIGEGWITETMLYKIVCLLFPSHKVIHHYRGKELQGLELDIWIPKLKIGIEYQGIQHYQVIEHWGGEEGLEKRKANDKRKKQLCKSLGYFLIEFKHNEELTEGYVKKKLQRLLN